VKRRPIGVGIIGGGFMGREIASAFARWRALVDVSIEPKLVGVADLNPAALEWFDNGQTFLATDYRQLLDRNDVKVVYVAVSHNLQPKMLRVLCLRYGLKDA
jgi:predicted dehydrogenase